jgi:hypothetical protein
MPATSREKAADQLETMARAEFGELSAAEVKLIRAAPSTDEAVVGADTPWRSDTDNADTGPKSWGRDRQVRAEMIRWLCINHEAKALVDPSGIGLVGAGISGQLDLSYADVPFPVSLEGCRLTSPLRLIGCRLRLLDLERSWAVAIDASSADFESGLKLGNGFRSDEGVTLIIAQVGGDLDFGGSNFGPNNNGDAIDAGGITVRGDINLVRSQARGSVNLTGANVRGDVVCDGGDFVNPAGTAILLNRAAVKGAIFLRRKESRGVQNGRNRCTPGRGLCGALR